MSRGSERDRSKVKEGSLARRDARTSNENVALRQQLEQAASTNQLLYQQATLHVGGLSGNEQAAKDELARVRGAADREQLRMSAELAKEFAERENIQRRLIASPEAHISRSDANEVFDSHSETWKAEEQKLNAEYEMKLAQLKSEAQIYSLQSAGANMTAHEFKQVLIQ